MIRDLDEMDPLGDAHRFRVAALLIELGGLPEEVLVYVARQSGPDLPLRRAHRLELARREALS